jgi:LmbE family N-acetylglucosaminyl deacetylase
MITRRRLLALTAAAPLRAAPLKIVVAGGHPGDPECGCAGTIARYTELGHEVVLLYLNRGEGYCGGANLSTCAGTRTAEAQKACEILKARAVFAGQYDGRAIVDTQHYTDSRDCSRRRSPTWYSRNGPWTAIATIAPLPR